MKKIKKKSISCIILIGLLLSTFVLVQSVAAEEPSYNNITVEQAKNMIESNPNIIVVDVRNQSEYKLGHLYNALLMPLSELQRLNQTEDEFFGDFFGSYANQTVLVYCKGGSRSVEACQILVQNNFAEVYNMDGGITAWMQANYPIYCPYHYASIVNQHSIDIEPWLLHTGDGCPCQNQTVPVFENPLDVLRNANLTVIEQNENQTIVLESFSINGTIHEMTYTKTLLWKYNHSGGGVNNSITLSSVAVENDNMSAELLLLNFTTQRSDYILAVDTTLNLGGAEHYNGSITKITYTPAGILAVPTSEAFQFNSTVTLSEEYHLLAKLAKDLGDVYGDSEDDVLASYKDYYKNIKQSLNFLSGAVATQIPEYDLMILEPNIGKLGVGSSDPEAILNGNFEDGDSYWAMSGYGIHSITNYLGYGGSNSLVIGWDWYNYYGAGYRDDAYQLISLPSNAINQHLSFVHQYRSDSDNMGFEVYIAPLGGSPDLVYYVQGMGYYDYDYVDIDLSLYSGDIYIYFSVINWDGVNPAGDWIDEVSVLYDIDDDPGGGGSEGNILDCFYCITSIILFGIGFPICDACLGFIISCTFAPEVCIFLMAFFCGSCIVAIAQIDWYCLSCAIALGLPI